MMLHSYFRLINLVDDLFENSFIFVKNYFVFIVVGCLSISWINQKEKAAEEEPEMDPDVAAMMGFGGFRSSKK